MTEKHWSPALPEKLKIIFEYEVHAEKGNFQKSGPQKRKASERKENILISHQKQHQMLLTTIGSGLSQLIEDEETPETMRGPLKVLKHYTKFEDKDAAPPKKIIKVEKQDQEYFEYDDTKKEPMESEESAQVPEQQAITCCKCCSCCHTYYTLDCKFAPACQLQQQKITTLSS